MMTFSRRLAVLALPVLAALPLSTTANAAPVAGPASNARACVPGTSYISNQGTVGLGVMNDWRGYGRIYAEGYHDRVLPVGQRTDCASGFGWSYADGYYIGSGYCAEIRTTDSRGRWVHHDTVLAGQSWRPDLGRSFERWEVNPYRC